MGEQARRCDCCFLLFFGGEGGIGWWVLGDFLEEAGVLLLGRNGGWLLKDVFFLAGAGGIPLGNYFWDGSFGRGQKTAREKGN